MKYLFLVVLVSIAGYGHGQLTNRESKVIASLSKQLNDDLVTDNLHAGISAVLIKDGRVIWAGAFGYATTTSDKPADTTTIYRIGSLTKAFTATLLMQLVEEGKVGLDDPVEKYVPEVKNLQGYTPITLRQLASHTSGLKREPDMRGADVGPLDQWENKVLDCIPNTSFDSPPGTKYLYSNIGYAILGLALERASGVPYIQMVQQRIFTPLHMDDSYFMMPEEKMPRLAEGISNNKDGRVNLNLPVTELKGRGYRVPNGGIFSTPLDLSKFVLSLTGVNPLLKPGSLREMRMVPPGGEHYGLGIGITHSRQLNAIGHGGSVPGYTSEYLIEDYTAKGYGLILMRNINTGSTDLARVCHDVVETLAY